MVIKHLYQMKIKNDYNDLQRSKSIITKETVNCLHKCFNNRKIC